MFKKVLFGVLLIGVIAVLAVGAIVRTMDRTGSGYETRGQGRGRVANAVMPYEGNTDSQFGNGQGRGADNSLNLAEAKAVEWVTLQGMVVSVDENRMVIQTASGEKVAVENRPWWFALEQEFTAQVGDQIKLIGFYEDTTFETARIENATNSKLVQLRDETGRPGWAGRGRRGG